MAKQKLDIGELSQKVFDNSMKLIDRGEKIIDIATKAGVGYAGYVAFQHPVGALFSLLGLQLAKSDNLAAGAAGVTMLAATGITDFIRTLALFPPSTPPTPSTPPVFTPPTTMIVPYFEPGQMTFPGGWISA